MPNRREESWSDQWGTLYVVIAGPVLKRDKFIDLFKGTLIAKRFVTTQTPAGFRYQPKVKVDEYGFATVLDGPFKGTVINEGDKWINIFKWNLHRKGDLIVSEQLEGNIRDEVRKNIFRTLRGKGYNPITTSFKRYGFPLAGDRGVPRTPELPPKPIVPLEPVPEPKPPATPDKFTPGKVPGLPDIPFTEELEEKLGFNPWWLLAGAGALFILIGLTRKK